MWRDHLPASVTFCDVETTGLGHHDRIVSFGGIGMISPDLAKGRPDLAFLYLVFDPGTENRRGAEWIHGFSRWLGQQQRTHPRRCGSVRRWSDDAAVDKAFHHRP